MIGMYDRLNLHVGASNRALVRAASRKLLKRYRFDPTPAVKQARHALYRNLIKQHADARELYRYVVTGRF